MDDVELAENEFGVVNVGKRAVEMGRLTGWCIVGCTGLLSLTDGGLVSWDRCNECPQCPPDGRPSHPKKEVAKLNTHINAQLI